MESWNFPQILFLKLLGSVWDRGGQLLCLVFMSCMLYILNLKRGRGRKRLVEQAACSGDQMFRRHCNQGKLFRSRALKVKPAVVSKCVQTVGKAKYLNEHCAALIKKSNDALTKDKGPKPISKNRACATATSRKREAGNMISLNRDA